MLEVRDLEKSYGPLKVLRGVNLRVEGGQIYSLVGKNGAGKTTTIRCIMGFLNPNRGSVKVDGKEVRKNLKYVHRITGYVPQRVSLPPDLRVEEVLYFTADIRNADRKKADAILEEVGLQGDRTKRVRELSGGMLQRLGIALALMSEPKFLIMDEPLLNLDPYWQEYLKKKLQELKKKNTAILLSIHNLKDAEEISDVIGILSQGRIIQEGSPLDLRRLMQIHSVMRILPDGDLERAYRLLQEKGFSPSIANFWITLSITSEEKAKVMDLLKENGITIKDVYIEEVPLEEVISEMMEGRTQKIT